MQVVRMEGISKSFGAVQALHEVDLSVEAGCIHALVGENGAGKTTLMRILYGAIQPDGGRIFLGEKEVSFVRSAEAIAAGVGMVSQHYSIIPELSCLENLMLGAEPGAFINRREAATRAEELAKSMGFSFSWFETASHLSPAAAQKLEILKLLWRRASIMILDEPTAMLSPADSDALFASLKQLTDGGATVILVTHRLPEVLDHCSTVTVLRGGKKMGDQAVKDTTGRELAELIIGHAPPPPARHEPPTTSDLALHIQDLVVQGRRGETALKGAGLKLLKGEVLGIAGVDGSGQRELFHVLSGLVSARSGTITLDGQTINRLSPAQRIALGLRIIPEDRHAEGVVEEWPLEENAALGLQRQPPFSKGPWIDTDGRKRMAQATADRFSTRHGGLDMPMHNLSGGNQQRFVAARALNLDPKLILAFQPARGLDIDATRNVYDAIHAECAKGASALVVSFDLDELLENCDRVVAMNLGKIYEPPPDKAMDRAAIGELMVGAA